MTLLLRASLLLLALCLALPGAVVTADEAKDEDPPPIIEDEPTEPTKPKEGEEEATTPEAPPPPMAEPQLFENAETPPGMVYVPPGKAVIGTTYERLGADLLRGRPKEIQKDFAFEVPQHTVDMGGYFMDRHELTNAQYHRFLQDTAVRTYNTDEATLANLEEVAGYLMHVPKERWRDDDVAWRQLYRANRDKLHEKMPQYIKKDPADQLDEKATEDAFHYAPLVRGMELVFYGRKPPEIWPDTSPPEWLLDHPVVSVSYDDAEAFAEWAGKHVPTEYEWEYAARGPEGFFWPWGNQWFPDASRANWGGKLTDEKTFNPITLAVHSMPEGQSWCGVFHMLGNVAEFTSSWFAPYPGNEREHHYMGEYVKIIRGASHVDQDPLALRLAARNFVGGGVKAPPRPGNRFEYVGFRCAWYGQPGRDQLGPIVRRVSRGRRVTAKSLVMDRYAGTSATKWAASEEGVENHVYVLGKAHAIAIIPLKTLLQPAQKEPKIRTRKALLKASEESADPLPLAVLHTDVALDKVYVRAPKPPGEKPRRRNGRRKDKPEPPATERGTCAPGTYVVGFWHRRVCLCLPSLEFVCFLKKDAAKTGEIDLADVKPDKFPAATIEVVADADVVFLSLALPVGGSGTDEELTLVAKTVTLNTEGGALTDAGTWNTYLRE